MCRRVLNCFKTSSTEKCYRNRVTSDQRWYSSNNFSGTVNKKQTWASRIAVAAGIGIACGGGYGLYEMFAAPDRRRFDSPSGIDNTDSAKQKAVSFPPPNMKITRQVKGNLNYLDLDFVLFQYQFCPFCCKVRAFLEYYGIPYSIVEVNPVIRKETKFSQYGKVPLLMVGGDPGSYQELKDSSAIVSILATYLLDPTQSLTGRVLPKFQSITYTDEATKKEVTQVMNRYFILYDLMGLVPQDYGELNEERKWRQWVDDHFIHVISPNIFRTLEESKDTFVQFYENTSYLKENFPTLERKLIIYVGTAVMYLIARGLKKKYKLKEDVRESLYDGANDWMNALNGRAFMGGKKPNLADLAMYGVLSSFECCRAFKDLETKTGIGRWYTDVKYHILQHSGSSLVPVPEKLKT